MRDRQGAQITRYSILPGRRWPMSEIDAHRASCKKWKHACSNLKHVGRFCHKGPKQGGSVCHSSNVRAILCRTKGGENSEYGGVVLMFLSLPPPLMLTLAIVVGPHKLEELLRCNSCWWWARAIFWLQSGCCFLSQIRNVCLGLEDLSLTV